MSNLDHLDQKGVPIAANQVAYNIPREIRIVNVPGAEIPGVNYSFELKLVVLIKYFYFFTEYQSSHIRNKK